jgi:hypothetical protein
MKRPTPSSVKASMLNCSAAAAIAACAACSSGESAGADMIVNTTQRWMPTKHYQVRKQSTVLIYIQKTPASIFVWQIPRYPAEADSPAVPCQRAKLMITNPVMPWVFGRPPHPVGLPAVVLPGPSRANAQSSPHGSFESRLVVEMARSACRATA